VEQSKTRTKARKQSHCSDLFFAPSGPSDLFVACIRSLLSGRAKKKLGRGSAVDDGRGGRPTLRRRIRALEREFEDGAMATV
jgi:hypothetical protein